MASCQKLPRYITCTEHRQRQSDGRKAAWALVPVCPCGKRHRDESIREHCPRIPPAKRVKKQRTKIIVRGGNFDSRGALLLLTGAA